jgi:hypothetical protein
MMNFGQKDIFVSVEGTVEEGLSAVLYVAGLRIDLL